MISSPQRPLTTDNTHTRQTSMLPGGFEPTISAGERPQTYALHRAAIETGRVTSCRQYTTTRDVSIKLIFQFLSIQLLYPNFLSLYLMPTILQSSRTPQTCSTTPYMGNLGALSLCYFKRPQGNPTTTHINIWREPTLCVCGCIASA
jgi:hypothetical protein